VNLIELSSPGRASAPNEKAPEADWAESRLAFRADQEVGRRVTFLIASRQKLLKSCVAYLKHIIINFYKIYCFEFGIFSVLVQRLL
jgi:hypothetical protein